MTEPAEVTMMALGHLPVILFVHSVGARAVGFSTSFTVALWRACKMSKRSLSVQLWMEAGWERIDDSRLERPRGAYGMG
jgi:hypothetical protein